MKWEIFRILLKHVSNHLSVLFQFAWLCVWEFLIYFVLTIHSYHKYKCIDRIRGITIHRWREAFYSLLVIFLLVTRYFLIATRYSLLVTCYFLLVTRYFLLVTPCYLLLLTGTHYALFVQYCIIFTMFPLNYTSVPEKENTSLNGCFSLVGRYCLPCRFNCI